MSLPGAHTAREGSRAAKEVQWDFDLRKWDPFFRCFSVDLLLNEVRETKTSERVDNSLLRPQL
jgi:hypothetical protein